MRLSDYGLKEPTTFMEAMEVINKLLDRCDQLNEVIEDIESGCIDIL